MFLASRCPGCDRPGPAPCRECVKLLRPSAPIAPLPGVTACRAVLDYEGIARDLVARVKYRNQRQILVWLARAMTRLVEPGAADVVTWAPTTPARRRARGFDHAELLARRVGRGLGLPAVRLLDRVEGPAQTGGTRSQRWAAPSFSPRVPVSGLTVIVVDDVITTGATMAAAASALRRGGAAAVEGLAAAHTR